MGLSFELNCEKKPDVRCTTVVRCLYLSSSAAGTGLVAGVAEIVVLPNEPDEGVLVDQDEGAPRPHGLTQLDHGLHALHGREPSTVVGQQQIL